MALNFTTALTHEANCFSVSEIVFKMTKIPDHKPHDTLPMNHHRWIKQTPENKTTKENIEN
jgi:hypothetical protein